MLAFVRGYDMSVSPYKGARSAENTYKYELGRARRDYSCGIMLLCMQVLENLAASLPYLFSYLTYHVKVLT